MGKNVMIPAPLLDRIIELLGYWDVSKYDIVIRSEWYNILYQLNLKKQKLALRDEYAKIIRAKNEDSKHIARINYLKEKRCVADFIALSPE